MVGELSIFTHSLRGLPYSRLDVFIQSSLDMCNELQLCNVAGDTNLLEQWGEGNLNLEGTYDVEWAPDLNNSRGEFTNGKFAGSSSFMSVGPDSKRKTWPS